MDFGELLKAFRDAPLAALVAIQMLAILTLFTLLVRSYNARIQAIDRMSAALVKMEALHERTVAMLERFSSKRRTPDKRPQRQPALKGE